MDFNDIKLRIKRVYSSINKKSDGDVKKYVNIKKIAPGRLFITFDNGQNKCDTINVVTEIIGHLAKLKDHLKNIINARGDDKKIIEKEIDESLYLQLVIDLDNTEKHGYPLTRPERSKKSPQIKNVDHSLVVPPQKQVGFNLRTGEIVDSDDCHISITGDIVDKNGKLICRLNKLVNEALNAWEEIIRKYNIS